MPSLESLLEADVWNVELRREVVKILIDRGLVGLVVGFALWRLNVAFERLRVALAREDRLEQVRNEFVWSLLALCDKAYAAYWDMPIKRHKKHYYPTPDDLEESLWAIEELYENKRALISKRTYHQLHWAIERLRQFAYYGFKSERELRDEQHRETRDWHIAMERLHDEVTGHRSWRPYSATRIWEAVKYRYWSVWMRWGMPRLRFWLHRRRRQRDMEASGASLRIVMPRPRSASGPPKV
jgi:hypothetical protein